MRSFRDRDFIESIEGMFFCVIGNVHPANRVIAFLKYVPNLDTPIRIKWSRNGVKYGRVLPFYSAMGVKSTFDFLKQRCPEYVVFDEYRSVELIEVPRDKVKKHYKPEERLKEVVSNPSDPLEATAKELVEKISEESGVHIGYFGITGSVLLKIHNPGISDIDIVVYGKENAYKVKEAVLRLFGDKSSGFALPSGDILERWAKDITRIHPLTLDEAKLLYGRYKWNRALYKGRQFSLHPVKLEHEVDEKWEQKVFKPLGIATIKAVVTDSSDALFMPAVYSVDSVEVVEGPELSKKISAIVSYEGLYIDLAHPGDRVIARGKLEEVRDLKRGEVFYQLTIGTYDAQGKDFLKPLKWLEPS
uniref:Polymerase nucleotidyl transferase domain-containing protein n=1 Tax=Ignisphaera aggregans TaxID=334771 RepID=A0A7C2VHT2_9CREN